MTTRQKTEKCPRKFTLYSMFYVFTICAFLWSSQALAADFIDLFNEDQAIFENKENTEKTLTQTASDALGGKRTLVLNNDSGANSSVFSKITIQDDASFFLSVDSAVNAYAQIIWNNFTSEDLTGGGQYNAVRLTQIQGDETALGTVRLVVTGDGNDSTYDFDVTSSLSSPQAKFREFTGSADFTDVSEVKLNVPSDLAFKVGPDMSLDSIELVCIADQPNISFSAAEDTIPEGEETTLSWEVTDPSGEGLTKVSISGVGSDLGLTGTAEVGPGEYTLTATNECSSNEQTITISSQEEEGPPPPPNYPPPEDPTAVPTMSEWGMILLSGLMLISALFFISNRKRNM